MGKKKDKNSVNSNNVVQPELSENEDSLDPNEPEDVGIDNSLYDGVYNSEGIAPFDYGQDFYVTTTRQPKNRNNRKKTGRKKDKKGKDKQLLDDDDSIIPVTPPMKVQPTVTADFQRKTTQDEIWRFDDNHDGYKEVSDTRYNPVLRYNPVAVTPTENDDSAAVDSTNSSESDQDEYIEGSVSLWTIYTVVGAIGGVIILIGLVAITLTLCCKKEEGGVYKSTPV